MSEMQRKNIIKSEQTEKYSPLETCKNHDISAFRNRITIWLFQELYFRDKKKLYTRLPSNVIALKEQKTLHL